MWEKLWIVRGWVLGEVWLSGGKLVVVWLDAQGVVANAEKTEPGEIEA